jgi:uncharacterized membrane protein
VTIPSWALTLSYWLHMLATVAWIGGLAAVVLLIVPAARQLKDPERQAMMLETAQRRLDPIGWFSLVMLIGTGLIQMTASPRYEGFLSVGNPWAVAILLKHLVFLGMTGINAYLTWFSLPELNRVALRHSLGTATPEMGNLQRRNLFLLRLNLFLGLIVLAMTAAARASV